jgi:hypothetical protein
MLEMTDLISGFPKNLAYTLKQLSNFTKQTVKIMPDRTNPSFGEVSRFKLPASALIDFRTISIYADVTTTGGGATTTAYVCHLPRNSASLINRITVTCNGVQLANISDYGLLYNTLVDIEGSDFSQTSKRLLEVSDPSVHYVAGAAAATGAAILTCTAQDSTSANTGSANNVITAQPIVINNFLGLLGSLSTPVLDLNDTGDIYIEIVWSNSSVLWASANSGTMSYATGAGSASFTNLRMTASKLNFESSEYYELKAEKLLDEGLIVGYYDYWTSRGTSVTKSSGVSMNFNINTNSLDQCIATFQKKDYTTIKNLVLHGSGTTAGTLPFNNQLVAQVGATGTTLVDGAGVYGDLFNNSYYFLRPGVDLLTSQWSINSVNIDPYPLPPSEIWNQNLIALGNANIDFGASGAHPGMLSLYHFMKYYFCHILSLSNLSGDGSFWRSGLSGNGSTINIGYAATFSGTNAEEISPVIFCRSTKILTISAGHLISVY